MLRDYRISKRSWSHPIAEAQWTATQNLGVQESITKRKNYTMITMILPGLGERDKYKMK